MLTGRVPYDGERPVEVAWQHVDRDVPPPSRYRRRPAAGRSTTWSSGPPAATRAPGPTDAGALLAEVQAVRDDRRRGQRGDRAAAARSPQPTVVGPPTSHRDGPSWARLPDGAAPAAPRGPAARPAPRPAAAPAAGRGACAGS